MTPFEEADRPETFYEVDARLAPLQGYEPVVQFLACGVCHTGMRTLGELCAGHAAQALEGVIVVGNVG
jgi:hypothetical protein